MILFVVIDEKQVNEETKESSGHDQLGISFNLTLTEAEKAAREKVILPHMERQTESKIEIESEDEDDPDDDLDI